MKKEFDDEEDPKGGVGELEEEEDSFTKGYTNDEEVEECAECGGAIREGKKISREVDGEEFVFCSKTCAEEFMESVRIGDD